MEGFLASIVGIMNCGVHEGLVVRMIRLRRLLEEVRREVGVLVDR